MRYTNGLTLAHIQNLVEAASDAFCRDVPFNFFVTINLDIANLASSPQNAIGAYLKLIGDWLHQHRHRRFYIWVLEHPPASELNCHILLHVPDALRTAFDDPVRHRRWLNTLGARPGRRWRKLVHVRPITGSVSPRRWDNYIFNLGRVVLYIAKGLDEHAAQEFGIHRSDQGRIRGKRLGISETLTPNGVRNASARRSRPAEFCIDPYSFNRHLLDDFNFSLRALRKAASEGVVDAKSELFSGPGPLREEVD